MNKRFLLLMLFSSYAFAQDKTFNRVQRGNRRFNAKTTRIAPTNEDAQQPMLPQPTNGDEQRYADKRASFGKILNQLSSGLIDPAAFAQLVFALNSNNQDAFDAIKLGTNPIQRKLVDPQAAYTYNLNGADSWIHSILPPPALASAAYAGEMVEVYWMALLRDVFFNNYASDATAAAAIADLNNLSAFQGPKPVTAANLFRSTIQGTQDGPYISQFLYLPIPTGPAANTSGGYSGTPGIDFQAQVVPTSSPTGVNDFMTTFNEWCSIQQGNQPTRTTTFTSTSNRLFIRDGRDLAQYVHDCYPIEPYIGAALILNNFGAAALDPANPYLTNPTQQGFVIYAFADVSELVAVAAEYALRAAWYQKWLVHRRIRPEFGGFLVNQQITGQFNAGLNPEVINSNAVVQIFAYNMTLASNAGMGTYFLPQAFPEGAPAHPSYPQGHATVAGACATILKAFFNEDYVIPSPVQPDAGNTTLIAYTDSTLTVGNELNKLAFNTGVGRDHAGVHYRSDCEQGLALGEKVAIAILQDESFTRNIPFNGYSLTKFDGTKIIVGAKRTIPTL